jgi:DNA processing protein
MDQERLAFLALHSIPGIGNQSLKQLISYCGSALDVLKKPAGKLIKIPGIGKPVAKAISSGVTFRHAEAEFKKAEKQQAEVLLFTDKHYPARLKAIDDAPAVLYFKGNCNLNHPKTVGIVGTRQATSYGRSMVDQLVEGLVPHQPMIISGLAYGIDVHAHKQALKCELPTVGVLGSGLDVMYPQGHQETASRMMDRGGIITENTFGVKPDAHNFPARNRIIAGMCDALIVVEAAEKGGALITADLANSYNKDVFAVPGDIGSQFSAGCNKLIKTNKAHLLTSVKDLEYIMNWTAGSTVNRRDPLQDVINGLSNEQRTVILAIRDKGSSMQFDELAWKTGVAPGLLPSLLLDLELRNLVKALPGKSFKLVV